ncbi:hypothetical protein GCM10028817_32920 [Spirosoma pomorum]
MRGGGGGGGSYYTGTSLSLVSGATGNSGNGLIIISYSVYPIRYVKATATGSGDGSSWANASANLQTMIDAQGVQQVWVAAGTYKPSSANNTDQRIGFVMKNGVAIYGGFIGRESELGQRPGVNPVTGQVSSTTLNPDGGRVITNIGLDQTASLDGVVITGGYNSSGGGISNTNSSPTLTNCVISNNSSGSGSQEGGGGINNTNSSPTLTNCVISNNSSGSSGGGVYNRNSSPRLTNCIITNNSCTDNSGGGILNNNSSPTLTNCVISNNSVGTTGGYGGGLLNLRSSSPTLTNCLLVANQAGIGGGGLCNDSNSIPRLLNCTLTANRAPAGAALYNYSSNSQTVLINTILFDNQESDGSAIYDEVGTGVTANYCLIGAGETNYTGTNNLTATASPFVGGTDYRLRAGSPAINAGDPNSSTTTSGATDLAGNPRFFQNGRIDMGAYEDQTPPQPIRYVKATASGSGDGSSWTNASANLQAMIDAQGVEQVWVASGRYTRTGGGSFVMKNGVAIYGGFGGSETALDQRPPVNPVAGQLSSTTLTSGSGSVILNNNNGLNSTARLDGVVITGGRDLGGGGIANFNSSPRFTNCAITGNSALNDLGLGGGIYNTGSNPSFTNCAITANSATSDGGGMFNVSSSPSLTNCTITGNSANQGAGIANNNSQPTLLNCVLSGNSARGDGGALYSINNSRPRLTGCTLTANRAQSGAALRNNTSSSAQLTNCILWDNQEAAGTSINNDTGGSVTASYCLVGDGEGDFTGTTNLVATASPFVGGTDYRLSACSIAINAGDPGSNQTTNGATDLAGNPRFYQNGRIDMGAYEFQSDPAQPVAITSQPPSASNVTTGSNISAPVSVTGSVTSYQWYKDGQVVSGQTSATLTLASVQPSQSGSYSLVVTGACNSLTSTAFGLTVNPVSVQVYSQALSPTLTRQLRSRLELRNTGNSSLPLADFRVRYYFTSDNGQTATATVESASVGGQNVGAQNVTARIVTLPSPVSGANSYLEIGYVSGNQQLAPQNSLVVEVSLQRSDNGIFDQGNDYSYAPNPAAPALNNRVTALFATTIVFGTPPPGTFGGNCNYALTSQPPSSSNVTVGSSVSVSASFSGTVDSYQWYKDDFIPVAGQTTPTLSLVNVQLSDAGSYSLVASGRECSSVRSAAFTLSVSPAVTGAPTLATPATGTTTNGVPVFSGTAPNGSTVRVVVSGATSQTLTTAATNGTFRVTASSPLVSGSYLAYADAQLSGQTASPTSNTSTFGVDATDPTVRLVSSAGASGSTTTTSPFAFSAIFSESVTGFSVAGISVSNGSVSSAPAGSGAGPYAFQVTPAVAGQPTSVSVITSAAQDGVGNLNQASTAYILTYELPVANPPTLTSPANGTTTTDQPTFSGTAPASSTVTVTVLDGAGAPVRTLTTTASAPSSGTLGSFSVSLPADQALPSGPYTAFAQAQLPGQQTSSGSPRISFTVDARVASVTINPSSATLTCASPTASLTAVGSGSVRWSTGSTEPVISVSSAGIYSVTLTAPNGSTASASASVTADQTAPSLTINPSSATLTCASPTASLTTVGTGSVRWSTGSTDPVISVSSAGVYSVTLTSPSGCTTSASANVTAEQTAPTLTINPSSATLTCASPTASLTAVGTGTIRWSTGSTEPVISVSSAGIYSVTLTSPTGCTTSASANVTADQTAPSLSITPSSATLTCANPTASLTAVGTGSVRWSTGSTEPVISVSSAGVYSVTLTSPSGCTTSASASVTADQTVAALSLTNDGPLACSPGSFVTLTATGAPAASTFRFSPGATQLSSANSATVSAAGTYSVTATTPNGCLTTANTTVTGANCSFAISGVTTVSCETVDAGRGERRVSFTPQYTGLTGEPLSFSVVNELAATPSAGPYTLRLYSDNPVITLVAQQGSATTSFRYDWLAGCNGSIAPVDPLNTPPTVVSPITAPTATVGQGYSFTIPAGTFTDAQTPTQLRLSVAGLPAGLVFVAPATISGTPSVSGTSPVTVTATDPGGLSASTRFELTVGGSAVTPPAGFAISGVTTVSCETVDAGRGERRVRFVPQYTGLTGEPVSFSVVNELGRTMAAGPYTLRLYSDNPVITLVAQQGGSTTSFRYDWLAGCGSAQGRLGVLAESGLQVRVLGNPLVGDELVVDVSGASGQRLRLGVVDERGYPAAQVVEVAAAGLVERVVLRVSGASGVYLLQVQTPTQRQTVKVLKAH